MSLAALLLVLVAAALHTAWNFMVKNVAEKDVFTWWAQRRRAPLNVLGIVGALGVAWCISIYSAIDAAAVQVMAPAAYTELVFGLTAVLVTPAVLARYGCHAAIAMWRSRWPSICGVGTLMLLAYMLVLQAYAAAHVSYVGALREVSIVFAALIGWRWLKESFGVGRMIGAVLIFVGMLLIGILGE